MYLEVNEQETILDQLSRIANGEMDAYFTDAILDRAEQYYHPDIWSLGEVLPGSITAYVQGSREYTVRLERRGSKLALNCNCPYDWSCKHEAAFLWLVTDEWKDALNLFSEKPVGNDFDRLVDQMPIAELRHLVKKLATPELRREVELRNASADVVGVAWAAAEKRLRKLLGYGEYHDPTYYEEKLLKRLNELRPFLSGYREKILTLLRAIWSDVNERMMRGELYQDYYDAPFDNTELLRFVADFIAAQPAEERSATLERVLILQEELEQFATTEGQVGMLLRQIPDQTELSTLLPALTGPAALRAANDGEKEELLERLSPHLDEMALIELLNRLTGSRDLSLTVKVCQLIAEREGEAAALDRLRRELRGGTGYRFGAMTALRYHTELSAEIEGPEAEAAALKQLLAEMPVLEALKFAVERRPELTDHWTAMLEKKYPTVLTQFYYERELREEFIALYDRFRELLVLDQSTYAFFLAHGKDYPERAKHLAYQLLDDHLPHADNRRYRAVIEALRLLRVAAPPEEFLHVVSDIRANYRRRRNLMGMLQAEL